MVKVSVNLTKAKMKMSPSSVDRGRHASANQMLADMNQFVPMKENILRQTGHVGSNGEFLIWNTPYAAEMFFIPKFNYTTPGTGPRWDIKAKRLFMSNWIDAFVKGADW